MSNYVYNRVLDEVNAGFRLTEDWGPILPQVDLRNSAINSQL